MTEVQSKLGKIRERIARENLGAVVLRGVDWFAWATGGGEGGVILTSETGVAEILVTENRAFVLTNKIEKLRLAQEETPLDFEIEAFAWEDENAATNFARAQAGSKPLASDRPKAGEIALSPELQALKLVLCQEEITRYRKLCVLASQAMTAAMANAGPRITEQELAGLGAKELWSRGLEATLILASGHRRGLLYRHPLAKHEHLGDSAMMVFCARSHGLYANLTRFVYFREMLPEEKRRFSVLREIENAAFAATRAGATIASVYQALDRAYSKAGFADEIHHHHQGGPCGYLSREAIAGPKNTGKAAEEIRTGMAFAWNPSLPGAKVEDTILLTERGIDVLTRDQQWPSEKAGTLERAAPLFLGAS